MALDQFALLEVLDALRNADAGEWIKQAAETIYQALIDAELTAVIGAGPHERITSRTNQRNGSRPRTISTTTGDLELRIPKLRAGSFFPALLERRRRVGGAGRGTPRLRYPGPRRSATPRFWRSRCQPLISRWLSPSVSWWPVN